MIDLKRKTESRHCLVCARCVAPGKRGGLRVAFRRLGSEIKMVARSKPRLVEILFLFSAIGIAVAVMMEELPGLEEWLHGLGLGEGFVAVLAFFAAVNVLTVVSLMAIVALAAGILRLVGRGSTWRGWFYRIGYGIAPLAIAALLFCMCAVAFEGLQALGVSSEVILVSKIVILLGALTWCGTIIRGSSSPPVMANGDSKTMAATAD